MNCSGCGHASPGSARFCAECGQPLAPRCASCGAELPPAAKFCAACGHATGAAPAAQRDPRAYTPKHLAEKILHSKSALEGERKQVTVLFADVKGSMELVEQLDPEQCHTVLDRFFAILTDGPSAEGSRPPEASGVVASRASRSGNPTIATPRRCASSNCPGPPLRMMPLRMIDGRTVMS